MLMNEIPIGGIQSLDELLDSELVRSEFLSPTFQAKVTIHYTNFSFNAASVRLFPDTHYIQVLIDRKRRRMFVIPGHEHSLGRLKWSREKNGKKQSRKCLAKFTCAKLFEMMEWIPENRYKIMAVYQEIDGVRLIVFNLVECEMLVSETIVKDDGTMKKNIKVVRPIDWLDSFGSLYREHAEAYKVDLDTHYLLADNLTGEDKDFLLEKSRKPVQPREPDAVEIMRRQYGGMEPEE